MNKIIVILLILVSISFAAADRADSLLANYFGKIESELSGLNDPSTVTNQAWIESKLMRPITAIVARLKRNNNLLDVTNIQTAFTDGGYIEAPASTYSETATVNMVSGTVVKGAGENTVFKMTKSSTASVPQFILDSDSNIVFMDVKFVHDTTNSALYGTEYDNCVQLMNACNNIAFINCDFTCLGDGVYIGSDSPNTTYPTDIYFVNCLFKGDSLESYNPPCSRNGISVVHGKDINIVNCTFDGFHEPGAIDLEPNNNQWASSINIANCIFRQSGSGILIGGPGYVNHVNIANCIFDQTVYYGADYGIRVISATENQNAHLINITNCTFYGDTLKQTPGREYIRLLGDTFGVNVSNCSFYNSLGAAVQLNSQIEYINVTNSSFYYCYNGIGIYGSKVDSTVAHFGSSKFGASVPSWVIDEGQTSRIVTEGDINYLATESSGADNSEGFRFVISTTDALTWYEFTARMYVQSDAYAAVTAHVDGVDRDLACLPVYTTPDSTKRLLKYWFIPTGNDTIKILARSKFGTTHIKIDSIGISRCITARALNIKNNNIFNPRNAGISASYVFESTIENNTVDKRPAHNQEPTPLSYNYGFYFGEMVKSRFVNNVSRYANIDLYLQEAYLSTFDFTGIDKFYRPYLSSASGNSIENTQSVTIQLDSLYANLDTTIVVGNCLGRGIVTGLTGTLYGDITAGACTAQPTYGGYYSPEINARKYLILNFTDIGTNKDYCVDTVNLLSGVYMSKITTTTNTHYGIPGIGENLIGIRIACDGSFATARQGKLIIHMSYQ